MDLGLRPHLLDDDTMDGMFAHVMKVREHADPSVIAPRVKWHSGGDRAAAGRETV